MSNGNVFTSPNGNFTLSIDDTGITLSGPMGSVIVSAGGIQIQTAGLLTVTGNPISLNGGNLPVARLTDRVDIGGGGTILTGNLTVLA